MQENADACSGLAQCKFSYLLMCPHIFTAVFQGQRYEGVGYPVLTSMQTGHADLLIFSYIW